MSILIYRLSATIYCGVCVWRNKSPHRSFRPWRAQIIRFPYSFLSLRSYGISLSPHRNAALRRLHTSVSGTSRSWPTSHASPCPAYALDNLHPRLFAAGLCKDWWWKQTDWFLSAYPPAAHVSEQARLVNGFWEIAEHMKFHGVV